MTDRERNLEPIEPGPAAAADAERSQTAVAREAGDVFLAAADAAIERALSATPQDFLRQNRQLGGQ